MWWLAACAEAPAPPVAGCERRFAHALPGDAAVGDGSDTRLAFSPAGDALAVGTSAGDLLLLDADTGAVRAERHLPEALIRALAFSADGAVLWVAEQSADAFVHALDATTLAERARARLADDVGTGVPPAPDDPWGVYQLPAAYHLAPVPDGVLAVAAHGWDTPAGRRNASRVVTLRWGDGGLVRGPAWPADGPADAVFGAAAVGAGSLAVAVRRSAAGPPPPGLPVDGVQRLSLPELAPVDAVTVPPLPGMGGVFVWDALAVRADGLVFGTGDGRLVAAGGGAPRVLGWGVPAGDADVPVAASVGFLRADGDAVFAVTSRSWSPGSADGDLVPASLHPEERAVGAWSWRDGALTPRWVWHGPYEPAGLALGPGEVVVAAGPRPDDRGDLFGFLRFARDGGAPRVCPTEGPVGAAPAVRGDGAVAVVEVPRTVRGVRSGPYQVSVWR